MKDMNPSKTTIRNLLRRLALVTDAGGLVALACVIIALSFLAGSDMKAPARVLVAGEIAPHDIVADRDLLVEDQQATRARREQAGMLQPAVFELSTEPLLHLRERVHEVFQSLNNAEIGDLEPLRLALSDQLGTDISMRTLTVWSSESFQSYVTNNVLPWTEARLSDGVSSDMRILLQFKGGILVRDLTTGTETLRTNLHAIPDIRTVTSELTQTLKNDGQLQLATRRAILSLIEPLLVPTLTLNREATAARSAEVTDAIEPVLYRLQRGEVIVRQGERVGREQQLKIQSLYSVRSKRLHSLTVVGTAVSAAILAFGLFFAPSGRPGRPLQRKDLLFISLLLLGFALAAKGLNQLAPGITDGIATERLAYCFPVAGAAGLSALIFSARRYCVTGLLLAFFCTVLLQGGLPLFLFFFVGAMLNTWLVTRAQTRQDVVWSFFPLLGGLLVCGLASALLEGLRGTPLVHTLLLVGANAMISMLLLFALSPFLEMAFRYTTRFRLMELMSLEQPLLQDLMVTVPGTYHHSLIVANMVEAGAKNIGANSLLCKVAALYHDIGKLSKPEYFIENQFGSRNKHDKLAPSMSALIITSHVKKGVELAEKHRLGQEIVDILRQHHGTRVIRYFFQKAVDLGEKPREEDYSYPGPRPQSREAAIVMLADAVEASSRTLVDPTPARIKGHIDTIVKGIFAEGQLDESELTFKDLHKLSQSFHRILTGIFHQRIEYPDANKDKKPRSEQNEKAPAVQEQPSQSDSVETASVQTTELSRQTGGKNGNGKGNATISGQPRTEGKTDSGNPAPDTEVDNDVESAASGSENALPAATARRGERDGTA